ncbi:PREDICTED: exosome complex component RRP4 [Diuraphis noxia]|uniref:exosome complex component RRP4 n=1 Tax=Diuraphis noxia TaxID=143948 RepID=UPI0007639E07|nr:PREDICTED: exosome complex component RRP4 [Diuraphis noxia]
MNISISLASKKTRHAVLKPSSNPPIIFTPGEKIRDQAGFMRGHGTYVSAGSLKATVAGVEQNINKLVTVSPLRCRYNGEIGDVVIARVTELVHKRWKVDINARLDAVLLLTSIQLPGGELRRRGMEDEQSMRSYLSEGDLISAEVHSVFADGSLSLHMRSLKYGKLGQGVLVKVQSNLIKRSKNHFHNLSAGVSVILGNNGYIWIEPTNDNKDPVGFEVDLQQVVDIGDRQTISRVRNVVLALSYYKMLIYDTSIQYALEESNKYTVSDLLTAEACYDIVNLTRHRLQAMDE